MIWSRQSGDFEPGGPGDLFGGPGRPAGFGGPEVLVQRSGDPFGGPGGPAGLVSVIWTQRSW